MNRFTIDLTFDLQTQDDGSLVGLCRELPIIVAAETEGEMDVRLAQTLESVGCYLKSLELSGAAKYLKGEGVSVNVAEDDVRKKRTVTFPILVGAL